MVLRKNFQVPSLEHSTSDIEQRRIAAQERASFPSGAKSRGSHCDAEETETCWGYPKELRYSCGKSHAQEPEHLATAEELLNQALQSLLACTPGSRPAKALLSQSLARFAKTLTDLASELLEDDRSWGCWEQESELEVGAANDTEAAITEPRRSMIHQRSCGNLTQSTIDLQTQFLSCLRQELLALHRSNPRRRESSRGHICSRAVRRPGSSKELLLKEYWRLFADWKILVERLEEHDIQDGGISPCQGFESASILLPNVDPIDKVQDSRRVRLLVEIQSKEQDMESMKVSLLASGIEPELLDEDGLVQVLSRRSCELCTEHAQHHIIWQPEEEAE